VITHNDAPQSVRLLWTSDQLVVETSTWQHTAHTTDKHPCPRWVFFFCPILFVACTFCSTVRSCPIVLRAVDFSPFMKNPTASVEIRTHDRSRRAAVDLRLRPHDHWDRQFGSYRHDNMPPESIIFLFTRWSGFILLPKNLYHAVNLLNFGSLIHIG
jgi:hypothetical protein